MLRTGINISLSLSALALAACAAEPPLMVVREDPTGLPLADLTADERAAFDRGDAIFERTFRDTQGLGPVYIRAACSACHEADAKGPGAVTRMAVVEADGLTMAADQTSLLPWGPVVRPLFTAGATRGITPPGDAPAVRVSRRVGPAVFGRGWIEAVDDAEIERLAAAQAAAGGPVRGLVPRLSDGRIGRFGVKARVATLEEFAADAFQGDMGLTSPLRPTELPNPDGLADDESPGIDLPADAVRDAAAYVRLLAMPRRDGLTEPGRALFASTGCAACHAPALRTRADYPVAALAGRDAEIYSDLLLHAMGTDLADGLREGTAAGEQHWRTAPLIGVRHLRNYLHDGRATTVEQAVQLHRGPGSEANASVDAFDALSAADRAALLDFVGRL